MASKCLSSRVLPASLAAMGLVLAGHAQAATMAPEAFAACVWRTTSDAERDAMVGVPAQFYAQNTPYDQIAAKYPATSAAIDHCANGAATPVLWKGGYISALAMEHASTAALRVYSDIAPDRLERIWDTVPADEQICYGVMTAGPIIEADKTAERDLAPAGGTCPQMKNAFAAFIQTLPADSRIEATSLVQAYAFARGGEAVVMRLMARRAPAGAQ